MQKQQDQKSYLQFLRESGASDEEILKASEFIGTAEEQWDNMSEEEILQEMRAKSFARTRR